MTLPFPPLKACPCASGRSYARCCQPFHDGAALANTPEALMRSRFSAYALRDAAYVLRTWHPCTRPSSLDLSEGRYSDLKVVSHASEGDRGEVVFRCQFHHAGVTTRIREHSLFVREGGEWLYTVAADEGAE